MGIEQDEHQTAIGNQILADVKASIGGVWDGLTGADRQLVAEVAADAAGLQIAALAADTDEKRAAVAKEKRYVDAALANLQAAGQQAVSNALWAAFDRVANRGLAALGVVIKAVV